MKSFKLIYILIFLLLPVAFSCTDDFEEVNTDPNGFSTASEGSLFNGIVESLILSGNEQFYLCNEILYKQTQQAALTKSAWGNASIGTEEVWSNYYSTLTEIRELERRFDGMNDTTAGLNNMRAMVRILMAYKTFRLTDYFGDIPFSQAGFGFQNLEFMHPKYDSQRDIYLYLLDLLEWANENIDPSDNGEPFTTFTSFDKLFAGDMMKWRKLANSLRLRYAMRMAEKEPQLAGDIIRKIIDNNTPVLLGYNFGAAALESASLWPAAMGFKNTALNWSFREHNNLRLGSNIWHLMSANDSTDGSGIFDPRCYIFFEGNMDNKWVAYPQLPGPNTPASGGIPYGEHRDDEANFSFKGECLFSPFNYFITRDEDYMPIIMMTGAEVHFIKAEAYFRGIGVAMDKDKASIEYMNGINTSIEWWRMVANNSRLPLSGVKFTDKVNIPPSVNAASVLSHYGFWNAASEDQKLKFIYMQRWIDAFRQPFEAYAEARRTGKTPREGDPINHFRLPYPQSEVIYNSANWAAAIQSQGGDSPDFKIWWIPD
ncbi:MAG: SusD/RagB family nutrient-binding outer membrane lipoprotein [Bacteroidales bacterium]